MANHAALAQSADSSLNPVEDTFVSKNNPFATFGEAGGLHVSGSAAVNAAGQAKGEHEAWIKFDAGAAVTRFDSSFGRNAWEIVSVVLTLDEVGSPANDAYNRGAGMFEVVWVADDGWREGGGRPRLSGIASANELSYNASRSRRDAGADESEGTFSSQGTDGLMEFPLEMTPGLLADILAGGDVTLVLSPADRDIGFTIHSLDYTQAQSRPTLTLTAQRTSGTSGGGGGGSGGGGGEPSGDGTTEQPPPFCGLGAMESTMMGLVSLSFMRSHRRRLSI